MNNRYKVTIKKTKISTHLENSNKRALSKEVYFSLLFSFILCMVSFNIIGFLSSPNYYIEDTGHLENMVDSITLGIPTPSLNATKVSVEKDFDEVLWGENFTLDLKYKEATGEVAIGDATIETNISSLFYTITEYKTGQYWIEFSGLYFQIPGIYYIWFNVSQEYYDPAITTVEIIIVNKADIIGDVIWEDNNVTLPGEDLEIIIELIDLNGNAIENAIVTYSWVFGTGIFEYVGDGLYKLIETLPDEEGDYEIIIYIENGYYKEEISINIEIKSSVPIIIPNPTPNPKNNTWLILMVALVALLVMSIAISKYRTSTLIQDDIIPEQALAEQLQIFDDLSNLQGILIIEKKYEIYIYKESINKRFKFDVNDSIFWNFLQFVIKFSQDYFKTKNHIDQEIFRGYGLKGSILGNVSKKGFGPISALERKDFNNKYYPTLEISKDKYNYLVVDGVYSRVILIIRRRPSPQLKSKAIDFINKFETEYKEHFTLWDGECGISKLGIKNLINITFQLDYRKDYIICPEKDIRDQLVSEFILENSLKRIVYGFAQSYINTPGYFNFLSLIQKFEDYERDQVKKILIEFVETGVFVKKLV